MRAAPAFDPCECILDFGICRPFLVTQEGRSGHDPAIDAVATLRDLFLDVGRLQWMRLFRCAKAGKRRDLGVADSRNCCDAGARGLAVEMYRACAALREAAAEVRIIETKVIPQRIKQRHVGVGFNGVRLAVDNQRKSLGHRVSAPEPHYGPLLTASPGTIAAFCLWHLR